MFMRSLLCRLGMSRLELVLGVCVGTSRLCPDVPGGKEALPRCGWARKGSAQMCLGANRLCPEVAGHENAQPRCAWVETGFAQMWLGTNRLCPDVPGCKQVAAE